MDGLRKGWIIALLDRRVEGVHVDVDITSSARASSIGEISRPSVAAASPIMRAAR
jgi:hypothetical protein